MEQLELKDVRLKLQAISQWSKLQQEQMSQAISITKDTILGFLKRQIEHGNWETVQEVLRGKPMTNTGGILMQELRARVVQSLIMRMGVRRVLAFGLALVLVPFILAKVAGEVVGWLRKEKE